MRRAYPIDGPADPGRSWSNYVAGRWPAMDHADYLAALAQLERELAHAEDGHAVELAELVGLLRLDHALPEDTHQPLRIGIPCTAADIIRPGTDLAPDLGDWASQALIGPAADTLDMRRPEHRRLAEIALAEAGAHVDPGEVHPPLLRWARDRSQPPEPQRDAVRAVVRAPWTIWRVTGQAGRRWVLEDQLGLSARWLPPGPVPIHGAGYLDRPFAVGSLLAARLAHTPTDAIARFPIVLPERTTTADVERAFKLMVFRVRREARNMSRERMLWLHGRWIIRALFRWAWSASA